MRMSSIARQLCLLLCLGCGLGCSALVQQEKQTKAGFFPVGHLFESLTADPLAPRTSVAYGSHDHQVAQSFNGGRFSFGASVGLIRWPDEKPKDGLQVGLYGMMMSLFDAEAPSQPLVDVDFMVAVPLTYRSGPDSIRLEVVHQSSHLGDEYAETTGRKRTSYSVDYLESLYSRDLGDFRLYGGGAVVLTVGTPGMRRGRLHGGVEFRKNLETITPVAAVDLKSWQYTDWNPDLSIKAGIEVGSRIGEGRRVKLLVEAYKGFSPFGQFYQERLTYLGVSCVLTH